MMGSGYSTFPGELGFDFLSNSLLSFESKTMKTNSGKKLTSSRLDCFFLVSEREAGLWRPEREDMAGLVLK